MSMYKITNSKFFDADIISKEWNSRLCYQQLPLLKHAYT